MLVPSCLCRYLTASSDFAFLAIGTAQQAFPPNKEQPLSWGISQLHWPWYNFAHMTKTQTIIRVAQMSDSKTVPGVKVTAYDKTLKEIGSTTAEDFVSSQRSLVLDPLRIRNRSFPSSWSR